MDDTGHIPPTHLPSDYFIPKIKSLHYDVLHALFGLDSRKAPCLDELQPILLAGSLLTFNQTLKKGDRSNPSNYRPLALIFCLSKAFESVLNKKIMRNLSAHNHLSDCQYGFRKGRSTGPFLAFLIESWSSSSRDFGETFAVSPDISKAFDIIWYKSLISKLPSYGFYPSLCTFISSFLSDRYIVVVVDGYCSSKTINSGVPQGCFLFLLQDNKKGYMNVFE